MPGLQAAIGSNPYLYLVEEKIARREFSPADAMALIRYSDLTRMQTRAHPGPHISVTAPARAPDFHLKDTKYEKRKLDPPHTMFRNEQAAATCVATALNTAAGEHAVRHLRHLRLGTRAALHSRTAATPDAGVLRYAGDEGVWWVEAKTEFVTLVLEHGRTSDDPQRAPRRPDGHLVLFTAYPNLESAGDPEMVPPTGADLLEMNGSRTLFWHGK